MERRKTPWEELEESSDRGCDLVGRMGKDSGWRDSLEGKRAGEMDRLLVGESGRKGKGT